MLVHRVCQHLRLSKGIRLKGNPSARAISSFLPSISVWFFVFPTLFFFFLLFFFGSRVLASALARPLALLSLVSTFPLPGAVKSIEESPLGRLLKWDPRNRGEVIEGVSIEGTIDSISKSYRGGRDNAEKLFLVRNLSLSLSLFRFLFWFRRLINAIPRFIDISRVAGIIEQGLSKRGNTILEKYFEFDQ